jgi:hypothetical protein
MFSVVKEWKSYRVHLGDLHTWLLANAGEGYNGSSADSVLTLWFEVEPSEEIKAAIDVKWGALVEVDEAAKFQLDANREAAILAAKEAILTANFDSLIPAERKLVMNMPLTDEDKDALVAKFLG